MLALGCEGVGEATISCRLVEDATEAVRTRDDALRMVESSWKVNTNSLDDERSNLLTVEECEL